MAFTVQDLQDLLALLRQHPEWREAVRREVLSEQLLDLPDLVRRLAGGQEQLTVRMEQLTARVDQLAARMEQLTARVDQLTATVDQLTARVDQLTASVDQLTATVDQLAARMEILATEMKELARVVGRLDGRVGNLEGWRYQQRFNARGRVAEILRRPVQVDMADLDIILDAREEEDLSPEEWKDLLALDFLFRGRAGRGPEASERFVALEVSNVVDSRDVQRAHDRAAILNRFGLTTIPAVGGSRLTRDAAALADRLGVRTLQGELDDDA